MQNTDKDSVTLMHGRIYISLFLGGHQSQLQHIDKRNASRRRQQTWCVLTFYITEVTEVKLHLVNNDLKSAFCNFPKSVLSSLPTFNNTLYIANKNLYLANMMGGAYLQILSNNKFQHF